MATNIYRAEERVSYGGEQVAPASYYGWHLSRSGEDTMSVYPFGSTDRRDSFVGELEHQMTAHCRELDKWELEDVAALVAFYAWSDSETHREWAEEILAEDFDLDGEDLLALEPFTSAFELCAARPGAGGATVSHEPPVVKLVLVAEIAVRGRGLEGAASRAEERLDAFRESVLPSRHHGITLYRPRASDVTELAATAIDAGESAVARAAGDGRAGMSIASAVPPALDSATNGGKDRER